MATKTNLGLYNWVQKALSEKWVYWYGTVGRPCTLSLYNAKKAQYPAHYPPQRQSRYNKYMKDIADKKTCADCVNLIKAYGWDDNGTQRYGSNGCPDTNANGMFNLAKEKGTIGTIPEIIGLGVRFDGHVGTYIGNGKVIEARGFDWGIVETKLSARPWTHWYKFPFLTYEGAQVPTTPKALGDRILKKSDKGEDVRELQSILLRLNYNLGKDGADGDFGPITESAVRSFQATANLLDNGIYDKISHEALMEMLGDLENDSEIPAPAPPVIPETPITPAPTPTGNILVTGGTVNIRSGPGTQYGIVTVTRKGAHLDQLETNGWVPIKVNGEIEWISPKYIQILN